MKPVCEIVVQSILPRVRALLAQQLLASGLTQKEVADRLGLTQAAVSQYGRELRGSKAGQLQAVAGDIEALAEQLADKRATAATLMPAVCNICRKVRSSRALCAAHRELYAGLENCSECQKC